MAFHFRNSKAFEEGLKNPLKFLKFFHQMTSNYRKVQKAQNFLVDLLMNISFEDKADENDASLLEVLLKTERFSKKQVRDHILTYLNAGLDTTAAHLNYTILFLAMHQNFQDELHAELEKFFDNHDETSYEEVAKFNCLERVIKESFRLAPPIFLIGRETVEDFEITPGCVLPKDTPIAINTFVLHRRSDIYGPTSNEFNPNRFLPDESSQRHSYSFQPFSSGRRNCIGYSFATIFIKVVLVNLLRRFKFSTRSKFEDLRFKYGMTLKLTENHLVAVERRKFRGDK
jgi:cytochrome P450